MGTLSTKNLITLIIGIFIGLLLCFIYSLLVKPKEFDKLELNFVDERKGIDILKTKPIGKDSAELFAKNFKDLLSNPTTKLVWPNNLYGWVVDAKELDKLLKQVDGRSKNVVDNVYFEMGLDTTNHKFTLLITGIETDNAAKKDYKVHLKTHGRFNGRRPANATDLILEYVDPCNPRCPE